MHLFEHVGALYVGGIVKPAWEGFEERPYEREAIELFLRQYAYERLGARADYSRAAAEAVRSSPDLAPERVWAVFKGLVDGGVNPKLNPLAHTQAETRLSCLLCALRQGSSYRNLITPRVMRLWKGKSSVSTPKSGTSAASAQRSPRSSCGTSPSATRFSQTRTAIYSSRSIAGSCVSLRCLITSFQFGRRPVDVFNARRPIGNCRHVVLRSTDRAPEVHLHPSLGRPCLRLSASRGIRGSAQRHRQRLGIIAAGRGVLLGGLVAVADLSSPRTPRTARHH